MDNDPNSSDVEKHPQCSLFMTGYWILRKRWQKMEAGKDGAIRSDCCKQRLSYLAGNYVEAVNYWRDIWKCNQLNKSMLHWSWRCILPSGLRWSASFSFSDTYADVIQLYIAHGCILLPHCLSTESYLLGRLVSWNPPLNIQLNSRSLSAYTVHMSVLTVCLQL
jgi:hypothetical protein